MIVTLTPNPSLDLLFSAGRLVWDDANRIGMPRRRPGGQGINVVRAARELDPATAACAVAPLGGAVGRELREMLEAEGTPVRAVAVEGETRVFVGVREAETGRSMLLNPRGDDAPEALARELVEATFDTMIRVGDGGTAGSPGQDASWIACCGSLLPGLPTDLYARVGEEARARGIRFVPDCDGAALDAALPTADLLVPNAMEAGRLVGRVPTTAREAADAARALLDRGPTTVAITQGDRGAVAVTRDGEASEKVYRAWPELPPDLVREVEAGSAVGAGDAFLAALLLSSPGEEPARTLARAVAAGTATLLSRGPELLRESDLSRVLPHVRVEELAG